MDFPYLQAALDWILGWYPAFVSILKHVVGILIGISFPISLFFLIGIIYCVEQLKRIRAKEIEKYDLKIEPAYEVVKGEGDNTLAAHWNSALAHIESPHQNDWKQAILEADTILDDLLDKMGYRGTSIGEKLKRVQPGEMKSLNEAWEAHKVRNQIAHEGASFSINQHEAKRVIQMYRKVFEEFFYI